MGAVDRLRIEGQHVHEVRTYGHFLFNTAGIGTCTIRFKDRISPHRSFTSALRNGSLASPEKRIQIEEKLRMGDDIGAISVLFPSLSWCQRGDMHNVFLTCTLNEDGELIPSPPEDAASRRIYRAFGAHRFLQVQVSHRVSLNILKRRVEQPFLFCGRSYSYLWCKKEKCPQCYV